MIHTSNEVAFAKDCPGNVLLLIDTYDVMAGVENAIIVGKEMAERGEIKVIFPTRRNLERLALFGSYGDALAHVAQFPVQMITPFMEMRDGQPWLLIPADAGYPVDGEALESAARG